MSDRKEDWNVIGWILPAAIVFWVIVAILILTFCVPNVKAQEPPPDPACLTEWHLQWIFYNHKYCDGGIYELYSCRIQRKDYQTLQFKSTCTYSPPLEISPSVVYLTFLPLVVNQTCPPRGNWSCFEGYCGCTIIGTPPVPPN